MTEGLGYERFVAHGGDGGSPLAQVLALKHPELVSAIHVTDIGYHNANFQPEPPLSKAEEAYFNDPQHSSMEESGYVMIQGTKPQTLAYGLSDSPVGLAAWIIEKFRSWSDSDGNVEKRFSKDELLTNIMIYWVTETINSSVRGYYEGMHAPVLQPGQRIDVPVGMALFPKDLAPPPRDLVERIFNLQYWTEMSRGGHFTALEEPELLANDLRAFFRTLK